MSEYFCFYLGKRNKETNKVSVIGPEIDGKMRPFYSRSRSFVNVCEIIDAMAPISLNDIDKDSYGIMTCTGLSEEPTSMAYELSFSKAQNYADFGLVKGYATIKDATYLSTNDYSEDALEEIEVVSPEIIAEMSPKKKEKYIKISMINTRSFGYICSVAAELAEDYIVSLSSSETEKNEILLICVRE